MQPNESVLYNEISIMRKGGAHTNIVTFEAAYLIEEVSVIQTSSIYSNYTPFYHSLIVQFLWVVMELVDGGSLTEVLEHTQPDNDQTALILRDSLEAIVYLHNNDIVHRDIKVLIGSLLIVCLLCRFV